MKDQEALQAGAVFGLLSYLVNNSVDNLSTNGIMASSVVVGSIFLKYKPHVHKQTPLAYKLSYQTTHLSSDELFWMEELAVSARSNLIDHCWLQVNEDSSRNILARIGLAEERAERVVDLSDLGRRLGLVRHGTVGHDTMLQAVQLPARVTDLNACLTNVD